LKARSFHNTATNIASAIIWPSLHKVWANGALGHLDFLSL